MPAKDRYLGDHIKLAIAEGKKLGWPVYILSGKYGLLKLDDEIDWYDHLMTTEDVPRVTKFVESRLKQGGVTAVTFYAKTKAGNWIPYHSAIEAACQNLGIRVQVRGVE